MPKGRKVEDGEDGEDGDEEDILPRKFQSIDMVIEDVIAEVIKEMEGDRDQSRVIIDGEIPASGGKQENENLLNDRNLNRV